MLWAALAGTNTSMAHTMGPGADMPNHNASAYEAMQDKAGSLVLIADRDVTPGDQIYISYGDKCNAEFLAHYGYAYPMVWPLLPLGEQGVRLKRSLGPLQAGGKSRSDTMPLS